MIVFRARDIPQFVMYCVNGKHSSSLFIESTNPMIRLRVERSPHESRAIETGLIQGRRRRSGRPYHFLGRYDIAASHFTLPVPTEVNGESGLVCGLNEKGVTDVRFLSCTTQPRRNKGLYLFALIEILQRRSKYVRIPTNPVAKYSQGRDLVRPNLNIVRSRRHGLIIVTGVTGSIGTLLRRKYTV